MIARSHALSALAGFTLLAGGCQSTPYEGQRGLVESRLDQAEDEGAANAKLQEVRDTLELAMAEEKRAADDQLKAQEDLEWSRKELPAARSRVSALERQLFDVQDDLVRAKEQMSRLDDERTDLLSRGVTEAQADSVIEADRSVVQLRITQLEHEAKALDERLALANLDRRTAEGYYNAANDRLSAAQARVALSSTLYQLADAQSRALEGSALDVRRSELMERMTPMGRTYPVEQEPVAPGELPTGMEEQQQQEQHQEQELPELQETTPQQQFQPPPLPTWQNLPQESPRLDEPQ